MRIFTFLAPTYPADLRNVSLKKQRQRPTCCVRSKESDLTDWCIAQNISFGSLRIRNEDQHRGLYASADIAPNTPLITIPGHAVLIADMSDDTPPNFHTLRPTREYWQKAEWYIRLAIILLDEKHRPDSFFAPYIAALPEEPWSGLWASQVLPWDVWREQMTRFDMTGMIDMFRAYIKSRYSTLGGCPSLEEFVWAVCIAQSRGFGVPVDKGKKVMKYALFPMLDMMNHDVRVSSKLKWDSDRNVFEIRTREGWKRGEQAFVSYGEKSGEELLMFYGFVAGGNEAEVVSTGDWIVEGRYEIRPDGLDDRLVEQLRNEVGGEGLKRELKVWKIIEEKCERMLHQLGDFSEEEQVKLEALIQKSGVSWDWANDGGDAALLLRYERWRVLAATVELVRHYARISKAVGRVCTVLMPPSQNVLKTYIWEEGSLGVHKFSVPSQD